MPFSSAISIRCCIKCDSLKAFSPSCQVWSFPMALLLRRSMSISINMMCNWIVSCANSIAYLTVLPVRFLARFCSRPSWSSEAFLQKPIGGCSTKQVVRFFLKRAFFKNFILHGLNVMENQSSNVIHKNLQTKSTKRNKYLSSTVL